MTGLPSSLALRRAEDRCRAHGFYLDPALIPPDDADQDDICAVNGDIDNLAATVNGWGGE